MKLLSLLAGSFIGTILMAAIRRDWSAVPERLFMAWAYLLLAAIVYGEFNDV